MSPNTVTEWKSYMPNVFTSSMLRNPVVIEGPCKTVEEDESCFSLENSKSVVYTHNSGSLAVSAAKIKNVFFTLCQTEPLKPSLTQLQPAYALAQPLFRICGERTVDYPIYNG